MGPVNEGGHSKIGIPNENIGQIDVKAWLGGARLTRESIWLVEGVA